MRIVVAATACAVLVGMAVAITKIPIAAGLRIPRTAGAIRQM